MCLNWFVVTSNMNHVVCFCISVKSSFVHIQSLIQLIIIFICRSEGNFFVRSLLGRCDERKIYLVQQSIFLTDLLASSNHRACTVHHWSTQTSPPPPPRPNYALKSPATIVVFFYCQLQSHAFNYFLNMYVRVSRVWNVRAGHRDLTLLILQYSE